VDVAKPMPDAPPVGLRPSWKTATTVLPNEKLSGSAADSCWPGAFVNGSNEIWRGGLCARAGAAWSIRANTSAAVDRRRSMLWVRLAPALLPVLAALAACGGGDDGEPAEDPGNAMTRVIRHELSGRRASSWQLLVREQREAVARKLYVSCSPGPPLEAEVDVLSVSDEDFAVPAVGATATKAVRWRMRVLEPAEEPVTITRTGHLIAQDGQWRWTLSPESFRALRDGNCP
jgi:hypothetical protein